MVLDFKYILFDVRRYKDEELLELANLIATVFFIDKTKDKSTDLINRLKEVVTKIQKLENEDMNLMCNWIKNVVSRGLNSESKREIEDIFQKEGTVENMVYGIERVIKKEKLDARMEGKLEGRMEKNIEIIRAMLIDGDSIDKIARITKLSVDEVEKIAKDITN